MSASRSHGALYDFGAVFPLLVIPLAFTRVRGRSADDFCRRRRDDQRAHIRSCGFQRQIIEDAYDEIPSNPPGDASHRTLSNDDLPPRARRQVSKASAVESELGGMVGVRHCGVGRLAPCRSREESTAGAPHSRARLTAFGTHERNASHARSSQCTALGTLTGVVWAAAAEKDALAQGLARVQRLQPGEPIKQSLSSSFSDATESFVSRLFASLRVPPTRRSRRPTSFRVRRLERV